MKPDPFLQVKSRGDRSHGQAISCSRRADNDYTKGGIMIIITQMALMARSANDQLGGGNNEKPVHKENTKKSKLLHAVVLGARKAVQRAKKRCKLNLQQAKYNVSKKYNCGKLCKIKQMYARKAVCGDEFVTVFILGQRLH